MVELSAMVVILGCSRVPAIRFATDKTRPTGFERLVWCLHDLGGVSRELLTDRDPIFCVGQTSDGAAILAPEWVDLRPGRSAGEAAVQSVLDPRFNPIPASQLGRQAAVVEVEVVGPWC